MNLSVRLMCCFGIALVATACGGPAAPPPAPKAATPPAVTPGTPAVMDPKGTIDTARAAAGVASAANVARHAAATDPAGSPTAAGALAAAAHALTPTSPKYDPHGRRDPFESLEARTGSDRSSVTAAKLTGVIHGSSTPLALVETSDGIGYILKPGDTLADGQLLEISATAVVFSIPPKLGATTNRVVLKLASD